MSQLKTLSKEMTGDELRDLIAAAETTQKAVSRLIDVNPMTVYRWCDGRVPIPRAVSMLLRILLKSKNKT